MWLLHDNVSQKKEKAKSSDKRCIRGTSSHSFTGLPEECLKAFTIVCQSNLSKADDQIIMATLDGQGRWHCYKAVIGYRKEITHRVDHVRNASS